ncbi:hypothetical protein B566_EDAN012935, partial [Ephemera danica]
SKEGIKVPADPISCQQEIPWRTRHTTTTAQFDTMRYMGMKTDCKIIVVSEDKPNPHVEKVHRLQLIRASPVFEAIFIYCDEIQLTTFDEACEVVFAAEKYQIKQLLDISMSLLLKFLSYDNVWSALKLANHLQLQDLTDSCIEQPDEKRYEKLAVLRKRIEDARAKENTLMQLREKICDEQAVLRQELEDTNEMVNLKKKGLPVPAYLGSASRLLPIPWRTRHTTTTAQFDMMHFIGMGTDCKIIVNHNDSQTHNVENVHRLQLIRASPVFEAMLMGDIFIYCDEIQLATFDEAYEVALAAEKYQIKQLLDISVSLLLKFVSHDNVWSALKLANHLKLQDLTDSCIEVLQMSPLNSIYSEEFMHTSEENLILFLEQDVINFRDNELLLVNATINWARYEAQRRGLPGDDAGVRTVIEPNILRLLRLATMPLEQFKTGPGLSDWLTRSEKEQIMEHHQLENAQNLPEHLSSSKKQRDINTKIYDFKKRKVDSCKRKVITTEDNFKLVTLVRDCTSCRRLLPGPLQLLKPHSKCAHAVAIFRVNSKCRFLGFECPSRTSNNSDPTLLSSKSRSCYKEILQIILMNKGSSLASTGLDESRMIFQMRYSKKTMYDSNMTVTFPKALKLNENNWYSLIVMFYSVDDENIQAEYPYCKRPDKVVCKSSGVQFVIQTHNIPGHIRSTNDGLFKTFFVTT